MAYVKLYFGTAQQATDLRAAAAGLTPALKVKVVGPTFPAGKEAESPTFAPGEALGDGTTA